MKRTYPRHLEKVHQRTWPNDPAFDDFMVVRLPYQRVLLQCRHPNCKPERDDKQRVINPRPKARFDTTLEAKVWAAEHCAANHQGGDSE